MSRDAPTPADTARHPLQCRTAGQAAFLDSLRRQEARAVTLGRRLLIRGFGVQVPGGAPVLTWGFSAPGLFLCVRFVPMFAPRLLGRTDPAIRGLSKTVRPAPEHTSAACQGCAGRRRCASGLRCRLPPDVRAAIPLGTSVRTFRGDARGLRGDGSGVRRILACPASWARAATAGPDARGRRGLPTPGTVAPARGLCTRGECSRARVPGQRRAVAEGSAWRPG
jgi:hypothetical protein